MSPSHELREFDDLSLDSAAYCPSQMQMPSHHAAPRQDETVERFQPCIEAIDQVFEVGHLSGHDSERWTFLSGFGFRYAQIGS